MPLGMRYVEVYVAPEHVKSKVSPNYSIIVCRLRDVTTSSPFKCSHLRGEGLLATMVRLRAGQIIDFFDEGLALTW